MQKTTASCSVFGSLSVRESLWQQGQLAVDEGHREQGMGTKPLDHVVKLAAAMGCSRIELGSAFRRPRSHDLTPSWNLRTGHSLFSKPIGRIRSDWAIG